MRFIVFTTALAAFAFGINTAAALAARAPQETSGSCLVHAEVCGSIDSPQCCDGLTCLTVGDSDVGADDGCITIGAMPASDIYHGAEPLLAMAGVDAKVQDIEKCIQMAGEVFRTT
ncbi:hypothetical protein DAEQUDRAFT_735280 [Daedalea quercina L-15889]|uniref:Hydrophobin n=1 Tax=Daedalea quercina L-15889 TaxID=1314783 RepID=A0A165TIZ1_9APHY|nr:hypothetical protein DAEQUDRAFT_735280 [Daedalea quercina L-15889]